MENAMQSESINELAGALAKAQGDMKAAAKSKENPFFKSSYADLPAIWEACRDALAKNGLAVVQAPQSDGTAITLETTLVHSSGQWMRSRYPVNPTKQDPQGYGSALSYAKRYCLAAMVGVVADDGSDDDGEAASGRNGSGKLDAAQLQNVRDLIERSGSDVEKLCKYFKVSALPDLTVADYPRLVETLNAKAGARK